MSWKIRRAEANPPLRYYVYVSDTKLEMLFEQIDPKLLHRLSAEAKVDLKLASLTIKKAEQPTQTRMAKLKVVERYIDRHHAVGTVQDPGSQYFRGTMPMRWGWLTYAGDPTVAFFAGTSDEHAVVLTGSRHHILGAEPLQANDTIWLGSSLPGIIEVLSRHISQLHEQGNRLLFDYASTQEDLKDAEDRDVEYLLELGAISGADVLRDLGLKGPPQWMEFLAVPLVERQIRDLSPEAVKKIDEWHAAGNYQEPFPQFPENEARWFRAIHAVLATPIYVALAAENPRPTA